MTLLHPACDIMSCMEHGRAWGRGYCPSHKYTVACHNVIKKGLQNLMVQLLQTQWDGLTFDINSVYHNIAKED